MVRSLNYQTSHARRLELQRQRPAPSRGTVIWNLSGLITSIVVALLSFIPSGIGLLMIPVAVVAGGVQLLVVGSVTIAGIAKDGVPIGKTLAMIASWMLGLGAFVFALGNSLHMVIPRC